MPRTAEQFAQIREQSREKILESALVLFAQHGFASTSIRMLAEEAGISQGLLYNYYDGKQALLRAIFERSMEEVQRSFVEASRASSPAQALSRLVRSAFESVAANPDFWRLSYQIRMQPEVLADLGEHIGAWSEAILSQIEHLLRWAGSSDASVRARLLFAAIDGAAQHYVLDPDGYPLHRVADELIHLLRPIAAPPTQSPLKQENA